MKYQIWINEKNGETTMLPIENKNDSLICDCRLIYEFESDNWDEAMDKYNQYIGLGKEITWSTYVYDYLRTT